LIGLENIELYEKNQEKLHHFERNGSLTMSIVQSGKTENSENVVISKISDAEILELYEKRSQQAIIETERKFGSYCNKIAMNILKNREDAAECVNDMCLAAWNAIPPERPQNFTAYLGTITRNLALNRYRNQKQKNHRNKNGADLILSELESCIASNANVEESVEARLLSEHIDKFLSGIREDDMICFVMRYYHGFSIDEIALNLRFSQSKVKTNLHRTRVKLKKYLVKRGIEI